MEQQATCDFFAQCMFFSFYLISLISLIWLENKFTNIIIMLYMAPKVTGDNGEGNAFLEFFIAFTLKDVRQKTYQLNVIMEPLLRSDLKLE